MPELGRVGDRIVGAVRAGYKARNARGCCGELIRMVLPSLESGEISDRERISGSMSPQFPSPGSSIPTATSGVSLQPTEFGLS